MESVLHVPAFKDNYIWLIRGTSPDRVAIVDPGDAEPVIAALTQQDLQPIAILCTHHHGDHSAGILPLRDRYDIPAYGPARERISGITHPVAEGDRVEFDGREYTVLDIPGHTLGHVAFFGDGKVFCGDTLFSAGCGRLFEGTAEQMYASLQKLAALPDEIEVYCGHEYTLAGLRFALEIEPDNSDLRAYQQRAKELRSLGRPTLPSTIGLERRINPFLRTEQADIRRLVAARGSRKSDTGSAVFATLRLWKDNFAG